MKKTKLLAFSLATRYLLLAAIILCALCIDLNAQEYKTPKREFRGGWLSTVWAIDWPGMRDNTVAAEKEPAPAIGRPDQHACLRLAVIAVFQKRMDTYHKEQTYTPEQVNSGFPLFHAHIPHFWY